YGQDDTTGGASQFRRRDGGGEWPAKQFHSDSRWRRGSVHEQGDVCAAFEPADDFNENERVVPDDDGFNIAARARMLAKASEVASRFGKADNLQADALLAEGGTAE